MRSVLENMMDYILTIYKSKVTDMGFEKIINFNKEDLKNEFTLEYKKMYNQIKEYGKMVNKSKEKISYDILKFRRLLALWDKKGVIEVDGGVSYVKTDKYGAFPVFASQNFTFSPTRETIHSIIARELDTYIEGHNSRVLEMGLDKKLLIRNLRDLRNSLMKTQKISPAVATEVVRIYGNHSSKLEIYDFSKNPIRTF